MFLLMSNQDFCRDFSIVLQDFFFQKLTVRMFVLLIHISFFITSITGVLHTYWANVTHDDDLRGYGDINYTTRPLQDGYTGLYVSNLNDYIKIFNNCLVSMNNFKGIDLIRIEAPIFLTRFDVRIIRCSSFNIESLIYFEKRHLEVNKTCGWPYKQMPSPNYALTMCRWSCLGQI